MIKERMALRFFGSLAFIFAFVLVSSASAETYDEPEAGEWLVSEASISGLEAKNREPLTRLVDWLYKDGAIFVGMVLTEDEASGLRIYLPADKTSREQILRVANRELEKSGYRLEDDTGQDTLVIWF